MYLATPKQTFESYECGKNFDAYNELKCKLVEKGIPQEQIAYIHEAKNDNEKLNLFNKVNAGKIRILLGSTEKCGAGTNVQKRLKAIHHLDAPYRPRDLIQRNGRGVRQGNMSWNGRSIPIPIKYSKTSNGSSHKLSMARSRNAKGKT